MSKWSFFGWSLVGFLCVGLVGMGWPGVWAAPSKRKVVKKRKASVKRKAVKRRKLPHIPILIMRRSSGSERLPIFRRDAIQGVKVPKKRPRRVRRSERRRLPTRPPQRVRRISLQPHEVTDSQTPTMRTQGRQKVRVRSVTAAKDKAPLIHLMVHRHGLSRQGQLQRWRGHILLRDGKLLLRCDLRSFCRTLRRQVKRLLRDGLRYQGRRISPRHPRFHWALRRMLERKYGYAVVSNTR